MTVLNPSQATAENASLNLGLARQQLTTIWLKAIMAPTINPPQNGDRDRRRQTAGDRKTADLVCRVKYCNTLPDIPFDPKFILYPFDTNR